MHKSQGLTIPRAVIDLGLNEKVAGLAYVAISRVRKLSDLVIEPTSHERLTAVKLSSNFAFRLQEEARLDALNKTIEENYATILHQF